MCVCVCVTPNHFRNPKAFAIIHHLSTAMSALQQCLVVCLPRPSLPLSTTRRLYTVFLCPLLRPAAPSACSMPCTGAPWWASLPQHGDGVTGMVLDSHKNVCMCVCVCLCVCHPTQQQPSIPLCVCVCARAAKKLESTPSVRYHTARPQPCSHCSNAQAPIAPLSALCAQQQHYVH